MIDGLGSAMIGWCDTGHIWFLKITDIRLIHKYKSVPKNLSGKAFGTECVFVQSNIRWSWIRLSARELQKKYIQTTIHRC
jgi:hypothetical protein